MSSPSGFQAQSPINVNGCAPRHADGNICDMCLHAHANSAREHDGCEPSESV